MAFVRIKNSMSKSGLDPYVDSGLRLITINLRIQNAGTKKLAVNWHICELRFVLRDIATMMTAKGHKEYIGYRNSLSTFDVTFMPGFSLVSFFFKSIRR